MLRLRCRRIGHQLQTARAQRAAVQAYDATGGRDLRVNEAVE
jgi:hypothetical protein